MSSSFPFLSSYDPPGSSEGTLDPLGLYQIADQLATQLVPAVRERMLRIRFLTAMAVGSLVTEGVDDDPTARDASPQLVWEWLVVEALTRASADGRAEWGIPGIDKAKRALSQLKYLDARSYLNTPRVFGFHGVYKRLAVHAGLVTVHLDAGPNAEKLVDAWARGLPGGYRLSTVRPLIETWRTAVRRSLESRPPRTRSGWSSDRWLELAAAFRPSGARVAERRCIADLLHSSEDRSLGALPDIWPLTEGFATETFREDQMHNRLERKQPRYAPLLEAIRRYEAFARSLEDAFDVLRATAGVKDAVGYDVSMIASNSDFGRSVDGLSERFAAALRALSDAPRVGGQAQALFGKRFEAFGEPLTRAGCARALCEHHAQIQRGKSADGKRAWFDQIAGNRIYVRQQFRVAPRPILPDRYVHDYRARPIGRFRADLV